MEYSSIAILALLVHIIINYDVLIKTGSKEAQFSTKFYRYFLYGVMSYYITDSLWGLLYDAKLITAVYIDTVIYYIAMAASVFLWTRYVINYLEENNFFKKLFSWIGWLYLFFDVASLIVNLFIPIKFYFDADGIYHACTTRYIALVIQILLFLFTAIYVFIQSARTKGKELYRHRTIGAFGIAMTCFVIAQTFYPLLPLYSIGYLLGTCLIHTFVLEDEKNDYRRKIEDHISREELQKIELGSARKLAYTDSLTGIKNKRAFTEDQRTIEERMANGELKEFGIVVFDLNGLKTVNDTKGHDAGDSYIKNSCHIICEMFKHSPVYRIGGDEFVAFLEGQDYSNRESLIKTFEHLMEENQSNGGIVIANGLEVYNSDGTNTFSRIFDSADKKMYERKRILKESCKS
ncbi:MAG: GGDEF domain-containing protein [Spirochaetaceae bacterium]|nr:GGDEF domain-containing protein [Spirochaetaceae bacterium]